MTNSTTVASPAMLSGRIVVQGGQWAEELEAGGLRVHSYFVVQVNLPGVGHTIARIIVNRAVENLQSLPRLVDRFFRLRDSLPDPPASPPRSPSKATDAEEQGVLANEEPDHEATWQ